MCSAALALMACHGQSYKINGTVEGLQDGDTLYLTSDLNTGMPSDTMVVTDGRFTLSGEADSTKLYMVYSPGQNEINVPFFVEPGAITIHLTATPGGSHIGGTKCNEAMQELNDSVMVIGKEINRIAEHIYGNNVEQAEQEKGMRQIEKLNQRFSNLVVKAAEKNIKNEFGFFLLTYYPVEVIDHPTRAKLIAQLPADMQQRPVIKQIQEAISQAAKTAEGQTISDFSQPTLDGGELSIMSEIRKNKITVIDFWASWCGPCRQEMPFMLTFYKEYKDKGLGIVGISLDQQEDAWRTATQQLGIPWPQMSDLKGWENAAARMFNVTSIPHTIVVDQQGRILKHGLRGDALKEYVAGQLK